MALRETLLQARRDEIQRHKLEMDQIEAMIAQLASYSPKPAKTAPRTGTGSMDGMGIVEAARTHLTWAEANGLKVTLGELLEELSNWQVSSSNGTVLNKTKNPWKTLTNVLYAQSSRQIFRVLKQGRLNSRTDIVELVSKS